MEGLPVLRRDRRDAMKHQWVSTGVSMDTNPPIYAWCSVCGAHRDEPSIVDGKYITDEPNCDEECDGRPRLQRAQ